MCSTCGALVEQVGGTTANVAWPGNRRTWERFCNACGSRLRVDGHVYIYRRERRARVTWVRGVGRQKARGDTVLWCETEGWCECLNRSNGD